MPRCERHHDQQHHRPEAEHDLDLAEQMPEPGMLRMQFREMLEVMRGKGVQHRDGEDHGCGDLDESWPCTVHERGRAAGRRQTRQFGASPWGAMPRAIS